MREKEMNWKIYEKQMEELEKESPPRIPPPPPQRTDDPERFRKYADRLEAYQKSKIEYENKCLQVVKGFTYEALFILGLVEHPKIDQICEMANKYVGPSFEGQWKFLKNLAGILCRDSKDISQGPDWDLFDTGGGVIEIQRMDEAETEGEPRKLWDDEEACGYVLFHAQHHSPMNAKRQDECRKAVRAVVESWG